jgi:hypothetical protein
MLPWQMRLGAFQPQTTPEDKKSQNPGKPDFLLHAFPAQTTSPQATHLRVVIKSHSAAKHIYAADPYVPWGAPSPR